MKYDLINIDIIQRSRFWQEYNFCNLRYFSFVLHACYNIINGSEKIEVSLVLTDDNEITKLNNQYRGKNTPTNVLSFPIVEEYLFQSDSIVTAKGDIVLSYNIIKKEAYDQKKTFQNHFTHLLIHGFLHLLGYDHIQDNEAKKMESIEVLALEKLGIHNPYINI